MIVWATVSDRSGHSKDRPLVILAVPPDPKLPIVCCGCTTKDKDPRPGTYMRLPWDSAGRSGTGLTKPCFAVADWLVEICDTAIRRESGRMTAGGFAKVLRKVGDLP
jgi:hypothetical protein